MIRWNPTTDDMGTFEGLLGGLSQDDREQCRALWSRERIRKSVRSSRRKDAQARQRIANLCWGALTLVILMTFLSLGCLIDSSRDLYGPDEQMHARAGREMFR